MSTLQYYRDLLKQSERIEVFRQAIGAVVQPGDSVLEIGSGLGTFAFFAADAGAERVWAVDGDPIIHVARAVAHANGYQDKIAFIRGWIPDIELDGAADVVVFEDLPPRLLNAALFRTIEQTRAKHAGGRARYVPGRATINLAPLCGVAGLLDLSGSGELRYGLDWSPSREYVANQVHNSLATAAMLLAPSASLGEVDFARPLRVGDLGGEAAWDVPAGTTVDGLAYWFDLEVAPGVAISNAPGESPASWGHCVLPIDPPIVVGETERLAATAGPEDTLGDPGFMAWKVAAGGEERSGHEFRSFPASTNDLLAASPDHRPGLSELGRLAARVFELTDGATPIRDIAATIASESGRDGAQRDLERLVARLLSGKITNGQSEEDLHV